MTGGGGRRPAADGGQNPATKTAEPRAEQGGSRAAEQGWGGARTDGAGATVARLVRPAGRRQQTAGSFPASDAEEERRGGCREAERER